MDENAEFPNAGQGISLYQYFASTAALIDGIVHCALYVLHIVACYRRKGPSNAGQSLEAKKFNNQAFTLVYIIMSDWT